MADALPAGELKDLYLDFTRAEARHHGLFARLARLYFDEQLVLQRTGELLTLEAGIVAELPLRPALH